MATTVLITGASSGIGKASARLFAERGWNVAATMRSPDAAEVADDRRTLIAQLDVADLASIDAAVGQTIARFGAIDVLVNNAGYGLYGLFEATPREQILEEFNVNVFGAMDVTRAVLPHMRANGGGAIVNVSSGAGIFTLPMLSMYCASKFALEGFSEAIAYELASQNIAVKLIEPHGGVSETKFSQRSAEEAAQNASLADYDEFVAETNALFARFRGGRMVSADDVANVIYDAATDGSDRLRYRVGEDSRGILSAYDELSDEAYVAFMRKHFTPQS